VEHISFFLRVWNTLVDTGQMIYLFQIKEISNWPLYQCAKIGALAFSDHCSYNTVVVNSGL